MILVDQRLIVVAPAIILEFVEVVDRAERIAQRVLFGLAEAIEIGALTRLAFAIGIAVSARAGDVELGVLHLGSGYLAGGDVEQRAAVFVGRTPVVDPIGDEIDVGLGDAVAAPHEWRKPAAVKRRGTAQRSDQAGTGAAAFPVAAARRRYGRRDKAHAIDFGVDERIERQIPEPAEPAIFGRAVSGRRCENSPDVRVAAFGLGNR